MGLPTLGKAVWNQRLRMAANADRLRTLIGAVNDAVDLSPFQWAHLTALALEFEPDLIIELGREWGNSTCCFLEAASLLRPARPCRVVSLCLKDLWQTTTVPRLRELRPPEWFAPVKALQQDILTFDFSAEFKNAQRCLVFWDAHGFDIAEVVLGRLLPLLRDRAHLIVLHDLSDNEYDGNHAPDYASPGLWKGTRDGGGRYWLGRINTHVAQAVSIVDYTTRNKIPLHSGGESLHKELAADPSKVAEMRRLLGDDLFSLTAHLYWFSTNEAPGRVVYPPCPLLQSDGPTAVPVPPRPSLLRRAFRAGRRVAGVIKRAVLPRRHAS